MIKSISIGSIVKLVKKTGPTSAFHQESPVFGSSITRSSFSPEQWNFWTEFHMQSGASDLSWIKASIHSQGSRYSKSKLWAIPWYSMDTVSLLNWRVIGVITVEISNTLTHLLWQYIHMPLQGQPPCLCYSGLTGGYQWPILNWSLRAACQLSFLTGGHWQQSQCTQSQRDLKREPRVAQHWFRWKHHW